jgi:hypothetical protein
MAKKIGKRLAIGVLGFYIAFVVLGNVFYEIF